MTIEALRDSSGTVSIADIVNYLEQVMQLHCQHAIASSGLVVGDSKDIVKGVLICLDVTEAVLDEAVEKGCNLLIANQPFLFEPLAQLVPENYAGRCVMKAVRHGVAIYIFNTNLDHLGSGASHRLAHLIELQEMKPIVPKKVLLYKLSTIVPSYVEKDLIASLYRAGAILAAPNLPNCISSVPVGVHDIIMTLSGSTKLNIAYSQEVRITFLIPIAGKEKVMQTLVQHHPYEQVPYYLEQVEIMVDDVGSGVTGVLPVALPAKYFLKYAKTKLALSYLQHTNYFDQLIKTVAIYAGDGKGLLQEVLHRHIDAFITTGLHYEQFLEASGKILMIDIGCYATRLGIKKLILALLSKEFNNIAILRCKTNTNPVHYIND